MAGRILPATIPEWMPGVLLYYDPGKIPGNPENHPFLSGDPCSCKKTPLKSRYQQPAMMVRDFTLEKFSFQEITARPAPALPPWGAGRIAIPLHTRSGNLSAYSHYGTIATRDARAAGQSPRTYHNYYRMFPGEHGISLPINRNILERDNVHPMADGIRVLYVDDEPGLLEIARLFLEETGEFTVTTATSAQEALASPSLLSHDAILADYQMPGMDGIAFLKAVRQRSADLPFLLFTGKGREEVVIDAINNGVDFYIQKGGDPRAQFAELAHKIKKAVERRSVKDALVNSEQRLNDIINFLPDATFAIDNHGKVIAWNRAIEEMTGVEAGDMLGRGSYEYALPFYGDRRPILIDLVSHPDAATEKRYSPLVRKEGDLLFAETTFAHPRNRDCYLSGIATPLRDKTGTIVGAIESIRDITGFQKVQEELKQSEEQYRVLLGHSQDGAFLMQDGLLRFCNEAFARMIGSTPPEIIGTPVADLIAPEDRDMVMGRQRDRLAGKLLPESYEFRMLHKDATTRVPVMLSVGIGTYRNRPAVIGTVHDMTKERERERALRESEEKYRTLVETSFDGILIHQDGSVVYANTTTVRLFGAASVDEIVGKPVLSLVHPDFRTVVLRRMTSATGEMQPVLQEKFLRTDGSTIDVDVVAIPFIWKDRPAVHVVFRDITGLKAEEQARHEHEQRLTSIYNTAGDVIFQLTVEPHEQYRFTSVNAAFGRVTGLPVEQVIGRTVNEVIPEPSLSLVREKYRQAIRKKAIVRWEETSLYPGGWLTGEVSIAPIFDEAGTCTHLIGSVHDITGRKRAEDALKESEEKYRLVVENSRDAICIHRADRLLFVNSRASELTGYPHEELLNLRLWDLVHPDDREGLSENAKKRFAGSEVLPGFTARLLTRDGTVRFCEFIADLVMFQGAPAILGIARDITERRQVEEALKESEEKYRELVENANSIILKMDARGDVTFFNEFAQRFFGYTRDEIIGKPVVGTIVPATESESGRNLQLLLADIVRSPETYFFNENENITRDGKRVWIRWQNRPLLDTNGTLDGVLCIGTDITGRRQAEKALRQANRKLNLLSGITRHDIKNQLLVLQSYLELSRKSLHDPEKISGYIAKEEQVVDAITHHIGFTRDYEEMGVNAPVWQNVSALVANVIARLPLRDIRVDAGNTALEVLADPLLEKVFYNLIDNALRYGGKKMTFIRVSDREENGNLIITVEDDGEGISSADKSQLFTKGFGRNTGLGLSLSREILSITGIIITENGEPGKEARFGITVPKGAYRFTGADKE
jgi:PAS domain S-box-containing protein